VRKPIAVITRKRPTRVRCPADYGPEDGLLLSFVSGRRLRAEKPKTATYRLAKNRRATFSGDNAHDTRNVTGPRHVSSGEERTRDDGRRFNATNGYDSGGPSIYANGKRRAFCIFTTFLRRMARIGDCRSNGKTKSCARDRTDSKTRQTCSTK